MLSRINPYNTEIPGLEAIQGFAEAEITNLFQDYVNSYSDCFVRSQQIRYFKAFEKGLLSNLDRKTIEPIALSFLEEKDVRGMQQFFTRSRGWDEALSKNYQEQLAMRLNEERGFLSVDESDFVKKVQNRPG